MRGRSEKKRTLMQSDLCSAGDSSSSMCRLFAQACSVGLLLVRQATHACRLHATNVWYGLGSKTPVACWVQLPLLRKRMQAWGWCALTTAAAAAAAATLSASAGSGQALVAPMTVQVSRVLCRTSSRHAVCNTTVQVAEGREQAAGCCRQQSAPSLGTSRTSHCPGWGMCCFMSMCRFKNQTRTKCSIGLLKRESLAQDPSRVQGQGQSPTLVLLDQAAVLPEPGCNLRHNGPHSCRKRRRCVAAVHKDLTGTTRGSRQLNICEKVLEFIIAVAGAGWTLF
jgi:hypothetical protein